MRRKTQHKTGGASIQCSCPKRGRTRVLDTRRQKTSVVRLRICLACGKQFKTRERAA